MLGTEKHPSDADCVTVLCRSILGGSADLNPAVREPDDFTLRLILVAFVQHEDLTPISTLQKQDSQINPPSVRLAAKIPHGKKDLPANHQASQHAGQHDGRILLRKTLEPEMLNRRGNRVGVCLVQSPRSMSVGHTWITGQ